MEGIAFKFFDFKTLVEWSLPALSTERWQDGHSDLLKQQQQLACDCNGYNFKCLTSKLLLRARVVFASLNAALINFPADPVLWIRVFWPPDTAYQEKID